MSKYPLIPLPNLVELHDSLRKPVSQTERNKREGKYPYYGATGQVGWIDDYRQNGRFILLGEDGAPFLDPHKPKAYIVKGKCWVNNHAHVLKGKNGICDDDYLCFALNHIDYSGAVTGSTRLKLPQSTMNKLLIPTAPFQEQHQIATRLKSQLAEVEKARKAAEIQLQEIKTLFNRILENQIVKALKNGKEKLILGNIVEITAKLVNPELPEFCNLLHVSAKNIEGLTGRLLNLKSAKEDGMTSSKYLFEDGDILYSKLRPYLRKIAQPDFNGLCSADMYPLKCNPKRIDRGFLKILLTSSIFTEYAKEKSARSRMPKLNREQLFEWEFILPSLNQQIECRNLINSASELATEASTAAKSILYELNLLPQKILAQAFEI